MDWVKQGLVYSPAGQYTWNRTHAAVPTVDKVSDKVWRIYFGTRDEQNRNRISYVEVEAGNPTNVLYEHHEPVLDLGKLGTFDDCGVIPSWIVNVNHLKYLYYMGWSVRNTIPYHNSIGLAISEDGGRTFTRFSDGPLFGTTYQEPYFTGTSCLMVDDGVWKNWYMCCTKWEIVDGRAEPYYYIRYAESENGIDWKRNIATAIDFESDEEAGIVRASVLKEEGIYRMWYSYRNVNGYRTDKTNSYRIGYAESLDGIEWKRMDGAAGIDVSATGWDSEMIEYPHVINHEGDKYMFYNGNSFGKSGFGCAKFVEA